MAAHGVACPPRPPPNSDTNTRPLLPLLKMVASTCCCSLALSTPVMLGVRSRNTCVQGMELVLCCQLAHNDEARSRQYMRPKLHRSTCCASSSLKSCFSDSSVILACFWGCLRAETAQINSLRDVEWSCCLSMVCVVLRCC